jgi:hypothetical protein
MDSGKRTMGSGCRQPKKISLQDLYPPSAGEERDSDSFLLDVTGHRLDEPLHPADDLVGRAVGGRALTIFSPRCFNETKN